MFLALIIAAVATIIGAAAILIGWRGRRVGDHPTCRRCGFDLFGKPPDSQRCPECGADLNAAKATVIGARQRRQWAMRSGAALMIAGLAVAGLVSWGVARGVKWEKYEPTWWLGRQAQSWDIARRDAALTELLSRLQAGKLSKSQIAGLVERGLKMQAETARPWATAWGDLIEQARAASNVTDEQWQQYAQQSVADSCTMRIRQTFRPQDPMFAYVQRSGARVGRITRLYAISHVGGLVVDGVEVSSREGNWGTNNLDSRMGQTLGGSLGLEQPGLKNLSPGMHSGYLRVRMELGQDMPPSPGTKRPASTSRADLAALRQAMEDESQGFVRTINEHIFTETVMHVPFKFELLPSDQPLARPITDEKLRSAVQAALRVESLECTDKVAILHLRCSSPPVDLCFDVILRDGTKEWPVQKVAFAHGRASFQPLLGHFNKGDAPTAAVLDIVLRPNPDAAALLLESDIAYFDGEVVIKSVPVRR